MVGLVLLLQKIPQDSWVCIYYFGSCINLQTICKAYQIFALSYGLYELYWYLSDISVAILCIAIKFALFIYYLVFNNHLTISVSFLIGTPERLILLLLLLCPCTQPQFILNWHLVGITGYVHNYQYKCVNQCIIKYIRISLDENHYCRHAQEENRLFFPFSKYFCQPLSTLSMNKMYQMLQSYVTRVDTRIISWDTLKVQFFVFCDCQFLSLIHIS